MIPQPIKWVGAVLALGIFVYVAVPMALESFTGSVSVTDAGGLFSSSEEEDALLGDEGGEAGSDEAQASTQDDEGAADEQAEGDGEGESESESEGEGEDEDVPDTYVVESGDTLFSIAEQLYGDGNRWPEIAEANDIDETGIRVGQELVIP